MSCHSYTQQAFDSLSSSSEDGFYQFPSADPLIDPSSPYYSGDASNVDHSDPMVMGDTDPPVSPSVAGMMGGAMTSPLSVSKFQQQLSGEWNQRVLRRDKYSADLATDSFTDNDDDSSFYSDDSQWSLFAPSTSTHDGAPMATDSIPAELSAFDGTPSLSSINTTTDDDENDDNDTLRSTSTVIVNSQLFSSLVEANGGVIAADGLQVLQELDADYLALRTKLLRYLTAQQQPMESIPVSTIDHKQQIPTQSAAIDHTNSSSSSTGALGRGSPKKTYWPAKSYAIPTIDHNQHTPTQSVAIDHTNSSSSSTRALGSGSPKKTYWPAKSYAVPTIDHKQQIPTQSVAIDHTYSSSSSTRALGRGSPKKTYWPAKSYAGR
jgi:hypothetical protein